MPKDPSRNNHYNNFDALRLILAVIVVFSHSYLLAGWSALEPLSWITDGHYTLGHLAVDGFFGISGFLVTQSWVSRPVMRVYLLKRLLRIYPGFIVACLFCIVIVGPLGADSVSQYFSDLSWPKSILRIGLLQILHLPPVFTEQPHPRAVNGSLWTISYEFLCYLFVPIAAWLGCLRKRAGAVAIFVFTYLVYINSLSPFIPFSITWLPMMVVQQLMFFTAGMVVYLYRDQLTNSSAIVLACSAGLIIALAGDIFQYVTPLFVAALMAGLAFMPKLRLQNAAKYGDFSYGVYLYAYPIEELLVRFSKNTISPSSLFLASLPLAFIAAWLSWHLIEKSALSYKAKFK